MWAFEGNSACCYHWFGLGPFEPWKINLFSLRTNVIKNKNLKFVFTFKEILIKYLKSCKNVIDSWWVFFHSICDFSYNDNHNSEIDTISRTFVSAESLNLYVRYWLMSKYQSYIEFTNYREDNVDSVMIYVWNRCAWVEIIDGIEWG